MRNATSTIATIALAACAAVAGHAQTFKVLYSFQGGANGLAPEGTPFFSKGNLYGTTERGGKGNRGLFYEFNIASGDLTILHSFIGSPNDASNPAGPLIQDASGALYGVGSGGTSYAGTIYRIATKAGRTSYSIRYNFNADLDNNASSIEGPIAIDGSANIYGVMTNDPGSGGGIFKLDPLGNFTILHTFGGTGDGNGPVGGLILESNVLYGATEGGGTAGHGSVWQYDLGSGQESVLWSFLGGVDGAGPRGGVIGDGAGNLYGSTRGGGVAGARGAGTVYMVTIASKTEKVLHALQAGEGPFPEGSLVRDQHGNLYGTTSFGAGSIFKVAPGGKYTTLYALSGIGKGTETGLSIDGSGNLYGVTMASGTGPCTHGCGEIFELMP